MTSILNNNISSYQMSNKAINNNPSIINKSQNNFLINECNDNMNLEGTRAELDNVFFQKSIYNFPHLIICNDVKRNNQNSDVYKNYSDVIYDSCGNRFNMRNLKDSAGILQEGYSRNIDVDSHLKNINYYADKCYYDNWKLSPTEPSLDNCNGLKYNASLLSINYAPVGRDTNSSSGICNTNSECNILQPLSQSTTPTKIPISTLISNNNTPITAYVPTSTSIPTSTSSLTSKNISNQSTDLNCNNNIRQRYDFGNQKLQTESCIKPADWTSFKHSETPNIENISKFPNEKRTLELLNTINKDIKHDYYQFFENNKCMTFPQQRLFNNVTKRSMLPSHHNLEDMGPKYFK
jgi:hypothetical protein